MEIRSVIAKNIADLRKARDWTQTELAQKLNYSDKAVSKWERAESLPDVAVLKEIADLFSVTVDYMLQEQQSLGEAAQPAPESKKKSHIVIALISASLVILIATIAFVLLGLFSVRLPIWMAYIYALPAVCIVLIVFNSIWGRRVWNLLFVTMLVWSSLLSLYLSIRIENIWLIFIIGIPAQVIILLWGKL